MIINGKTINGGSFVPQIGEQTVALIDTGNPQDLAPKAYVDAMYGGIKGAKLDDGTYTVPCDAKVEITVIIAGKQYPIHPIDAVFAALDSDTNEIVCTGAFSYGLPDYTGNDVVLGDPFLRNVYSLFDFGNYTTVGDNPPFVQFLSTTDAKQASSEFKDYNKQRLSALQAAQAMKKSSKSATPEVKSLLDADGSNSTSSSSSSSSHSGMLAGITPAQAEMLIRNSYIIIAFLGALMAMMALLLVVSLSGRKKESSVRSAGAPPAAFKVPFMKGQKYETLYSDDRD
jgi:hypothetical protein